MPFHIKKVIEDRWGENYALHERHVNPQFVRVLRTIGFDKLYQRAEGQYLYDTEGNRYLDLLSGYGVFSIGRNHPKLKETIKELLDLDLSSMVQMECPLLSGLLAEKLISIAPEPIDTVFFTNSGTEAVEGAIKMARGATGRSRILYLDHAFHGLTLGSLSANGNKEFRGGFGELLPGTPITMNDLDSLECELRKKEVAAFLFEPIQGKGVYVPDDHFLPEAERLCRKYGTLMIADEVQTGLGRTGRWFAFEHWNLDPDIICVAKALSGGFVPAGAILMRRNIYKKVFSRMDRCVVHSNTFGKNTLAMGCGLATLHLIEEEKLVEKAERMGNYLKRKIEESCRDREMFQEVRGKGMMIGIEFREPKSLKLKAAWKVIHAANKGLFGQMIVVPLMSEHRMLTQVAGHDIDLVKLLPPLVMTEKDADQFAQALGSVVAACHKFPGAAWQLGMTLAKNAMKLILLLALTSSLAGAEERKESPEIPDAVDFDRRNAHSMRFELSPYGGDMLADKLNHSFIIGGNLQFNITERLGLAGDFGWSRSAADRATPFGASITNNNLIYMDGSFVTTMPAVLASKKSLIEADFFTTVGAGVLRVNSGNHISGFVGGGIKIRPNIKWLAFRAEVRNYFTSVSNPAGSDFEYQIHFRLGPTFLLPPEL